MRKSGKIVLIVLLAVITLLTLVACDNTTQNGSDVMKRDPAYVEFEFNDKSPSALDPVYYDEFVLSEYVTAYVVFNVTENGKTYTVRDNTPYTVTEEMITEDNRNQLAARTASKITFTVTVTPEGYSKAVTGAFTCHFANRPDTQTTITVNPNGGTVNGNTDTFELTVLKMNYSWASLRKLLGVTAPAGKAFIGWKIGDTDTVFDASSLSALTISGPVELTALYTDTYCTVNFALNAPADAVWSGDAPADVTEHVVKGQAVARPDTALYQSKNYVLDGWYYDDGGVEKEWNFSTKITSDVSIYAKWQVRYYTLTISFADGTLDAAAEYPASAPADKLLAAEASYGADGKINGIVVSGLSYLAKPADYYVNVALVSGDATSSKNVAVADIESYLIKNDGVYTCDGIYSSRNLVPADKIDFSTAVISANTTYYVSWSISETNVEQYYADTFDFTDKADGTCIATVKPAVAATLEILKVPATYNGKPVTEIAVTSTTSAGNALPLLKTVDLSDADNLRVISDSAFYNCEKLEFVIRPENNALPALEYVGANAFKGTRWLNNYTSDVVILGNVLVSCKTNVATVDMTQGAMSSVKYIAAGAFDACNALTTLVLPAGLVRIENKAFDNCPSLASVTSASSSIEYIGGNVFENAAVLKGSGALVIGNMYYRYLGNETSVTIPADNNGVAVTAIAEQAFKAKTQVSDISFENESLILSVGASAFRSTAWVSGNSSDFIVVNGILTNYKGNDTVVVVPDEVQTVASEAFYGYNNANVTAIVFNAASSVKLFSDYAFKGATKLRIVSIYADDSRTEPIDAGEKVFYGANGLLENIRIYADDIVYNSVFSSSPVWRYYSDRIVSLYATSIAVNTEVIPSVYLSEKLSDGTYGVDYVKVWNAWGEATYAVQNGLLVTRNDGLTLPDIMTFDDAFVDTLITKVNAVREEGTMTFARESGNDAEPLIYTAPYSYTVFAAIDGESFELEGYDEVSDKHYVFYESQKTFNTSGGLVYDYVFYNGDVENRVPVNPISLADTNYVTVSGYENSVGNNKELTVSFNFLNVKNYELTFLYDVVQTRATGIVQNEAVSMKLGSEPISNYGKIQLSVRYNDGTLVPVTMNQVTIVSVDGVATNRLDTLSFGLHLASIHLSGDASVTGTLVYSVPLEADATQFDFEVIGSGNDAYASVTGFSDTATSFSIAVIPSYFTDGNANLPVKAIKRGAFADNTGLVTVYVPSTITAIPADAFSGCKNLANVYGYEVVTGATESVSYNFSQIIVASETRAVSNSAVITAFSNEVAGYGNITIPAKLVYTVTKSGADMGDDASNYVADANIVCNYTITLSVDAASIDAIVAKLVKDSFTDTVILPADASFDAFATALAVAGIKVARTAPESVSTNLEQMGNYFQLVYDESSETVTAANGTVYIKSGAMFDYAPGAPVLIPEMIESVSGGVTRTYKVVGLQSGAFSGLTSLHNGIYVPGTITHIENVEDFRREDLVIYSGNVIVRPYLSFPRWITSVGNSAFEDCSSLEIDFTQAVELTEIGNGAFANCISFGILDLSATKVVDLGDGRVFAGCTDVTKVILPDALIAIGNNTFENCTALTEIDFGANNVLAVIGSRAFAGCSALKQIALPDSVTQIGADAFSGSGIVRLVGNAASVDFAAKGFGTTQNSINEIVITSGTVASDMFTVCNNLKSVVLYSGVTVADGAFAANRKIESISGSVEQLEKIVAASPSKTFIKSLTFTSGMAISDSAFAGMTALQTVDFGTVNSIGVNAFAGCTALNVDFAKLTGLVKIDAGAFADCTSITEVNLGGTSLVTLGDGAFKNCTSLQSVTLPVTLENGAVGASVFEGCTSLSEVSLPSGLISVGEKAFAGNTALVSVEIPSTVTQIGAYAFDGCTSLANVDLSRTAITDIAEGTFRGCKALATVSLPANIKTIGASAFEGCTGLVGVNFAEGTSIENVGNRAFYNTGLDSTVLDGKLAEGATVADDAFGKDE